VCAWEVPVCVCARAHVCVLECVLVCVCVHMSLMCVEAND